MHEPAAVAATTREQLLTVAADLLQRVGYASFSFRDLATADPVLSRTEAAVTPQLLVNTAIRVPGFAG